MIHRRFLAVPRRAPIVLLLGLLAVPPAWAGSAYEVPDVRVDETAETASKAREKALAAAEAQAFAKLMDRLVVAEDRAKVPHPSHAELAAYIRDFGVTEEKASSVRYVGRLVYRFKTEAVRKMLRDKGVAFAETMSKPLAVVPLFQGRGPVVLWDEPNPWRDAWRSLPGQDGLVPLVVPLGDLTDVSAASVDEAAKGKADRLLGLATRYDAGGVIVPRAVLKGATVDVTVGRYAEGATPQGFSFQLAQQAGEDMGGLLLRATAEVSRRIQDEWKAANVLRFDSVGVTPAVVPVAGLKDWLAVRQRLERMAVVRQVEVVQMTRGEVRVAIQHLGDPQQLALAMKQADLSLTQEGEQWVLRAASAGIPVLGGGGATAPKP